MKKNPGACRGFFSAGENQMHPPMSANVRVPVLFVLLSMALAAGVYWIGLSGPFLFDDEQGLAPVRAWVEGKVELGTVLSGNESFFLHRSLAMGSFAINTALFGFTPFGFKLGNLLVHLGCGALTFGFLRASFIRDPGISKHAALAAAAAASVWLLHPLWTSTVLYSVQRMAQLAALCSLAALSLYMWARPLLDGRRPVPAMVALFGGIPLLVLLGIQGKQNAAVIPLLCLVLEVAYFTRTPKTRRILVCFFSAFLALPAAIVLLGLAIRPDLLLAGYGEYDFGPWERLLSQARAMWEYVRMFAIPYSPAMGVYTDDFVPSRGIFDPWTTATSLSALLITTAAAWRIRRAQPSIFAGWCLFLGAHSVEGTLLPLELFYEHRNYLPAVGLLMVAVSLATIAGRGMSNSGIETSRILVVGVLGIAAVLAFQTHGRARVWSDMRTLAWSAQMSHPDSPRAVMTYMGTAVDSGDIAGALAVAERTIQQSDLPRTRALARLFRMRVLCATQGMVPDAELATALGELPAHVDLTTALTFGHLAGAVLPGSSCRGITPLQLAAAMTRVANRDAGQHDNSYPKIFLRHAAARLYANQGQWHDAERQAKLAWQPQSNPTAAVVLVESLIAQGKADEARTYVAQARARARSDIPADMQALRSLDQLSEAAAP